MESCYITIAKTNQPEIEVVRIYPHELRRQYLPASKIQYNEQNDPVLVMDISYARTDCIVSMNTMNGPHVLIDCLEHVCSTCDDYSVTFKPSDINFVISSDDVIHDLTIELKKMIYFCFPDILTTSKFSTHDLVEDFEDDARVRVQC